MTAFFISTSARKKDDPDINFEIVCFEHTENPEEETKVRIGDCKIVYFLTTCKACWFPNAIPSNGEGFDCKSIPAYLEEHGFRSVTQEQAGMEYYMNYGMYWDDSSFGSTMYICRESAAEENLYGFHPIYEYQFWYQMDTTKVTLVKCKTHPYFDYGNSGNYTKIS